MKAKVLIMCMLLGMSIAFSDCTTKNKENSIGKEDSVKMFNNEAERIKPVDK
jgi:hypothetical protein